MIKIKTPIRTTPSMHQEERDITLKYSWFDRLFFGKPKSEEYVALGFCYWDNIDIVLKNEIDPKMWAESATTDNSPHYKKELELVDLEGNIYCIDGAYPIKHDPATGITTIHFDSCLLYIEPEKS